MIWKGDPLILTQDRLEIQVVAAGNESEGMVEIKQKGTFSTVPIRNVRPANNEVVIVVDDQRLGIFTIHFVRFNSQPDMDLNLSGRPLAEMSRGSVIFHGEIRPPDGSPPDPLAMGYPAIGSLADARQVAVTALANHNSEVRVKGFAPMTPVYHWKNGAPVVRLA